MLRADISFELDRDFGKEEMVLEYLKKEIRMGKYEIANPWSFLSESEEH